MQFVPPIATLQLFPTLDRALITLLKSLSPEDWQRQTVASLWKVKDVAAHLLDGNLRTLSMLRDGYFGAPPGPINSYQELVGFLNRLNSEWVTAMQRISPTLLIQLLEETGPQYYEYLATLDPEAPAIFSVAWAGEEVSANWFHVAREYTEKWHHQQQIRLAVEQEAPLLERDLYFPYLNTSMRALPHHYRTMQGQGKEAIKFTVTGASGGDWWLRFTGKVWELVDNCDVPPICTVRIAPEIAWRIFSKNIRPEEARKHVQIMGNHLLGEHLLNMVAVMA